MNLEFLDIGLPLEAGTFETTSKEIKSFRKYCELIGKKPEQLTQEELQKYYEIEKTVKKVKYIGESDSASLIHGKIYICLGEEHGEYRIIDEEGYDTDEDIQGYLYPKRFFVEVNDVMCRNNRYYDGHYKDTEFSLEEIEKQLEEEKKKVELMTEWEDL